MSCAYVVVLIASLISSSANLEAAQPLGLLHRYLDPIDSCTPWPFPAELDEPVDRLALAFQHRLDGAVAPIPDPTGDADELRAPAHRLAEEDALHTPLHDHAAPLHGRRLDPR